MLWVLWTNAGPTLLLLCAIFAWWFTEPKTPQLNFIVLVGCVFFLWTVNPDLARHFPGNLYGVCSNAVFILHLDRLVVANTRMIFTGAAVVWLLRRAVQTLWKPVPELIGVLGLEVPDCPDVSLTGIAADKATLTWTRAPPNRPVQKFLIQVNGVNVGEIASNQDNFIIVSGLKPDHFYNVRVIAVGSNNFQAGSRVIRLRTFARDGRPQLGNSRMPTSFTPDEQTPPSQLDGVDENGAPRSLVPSVETANISETAPVAVTREANPSSGPGLRRNTIGRRHSPSTASADQPPPPPPPPSIGSETLDPREAQMDELGEKYKGLLRETEDIINLITKEEEDHKQMLGEFEAEKQEKKKEQKKKEEQTEKLKREQGTRERLMRNALQRKAQKEKLLKEKLAERAKLEERIANFTKGIDEMRKDQCGFAKEKGKLEDQKQAKEDAYRAEIRALLTECANMETELKERRVQVKELEDARKKLPGGEQDAGWREKDAEIRKDWSLREKELQSTLDLENKRMRQLEDHTHILSSQLQQIQFQQGLYNHANSSGADFGGDAASSNQMKRRSRNSASLSHAVDPSPGMIPAYPVPNTVPVAVPASITEATGMVTSVTPAPAPTASLTAGTPATTVGVAPGLVATGFGATRLPGPPGFAPGPFMGGLSADAMRGSISSSHEVDFRALTGDAPLSPTAKSLLPSHIFMDMDDDAPSPDESPFLPPHRLASPVNNDPQSPSSSNRSMSILSSPHGSSHNLPNPSFSGDTSDRRSMKGSRDLGGPLSSPPPPQPAGKSLASILRIQRTRGADKAVDEEGPILGSLKPGQSQSLPRQTEGPDTVASRRRISLSSWNGMFNRNSTGSDPMEARLHPAQSRFSARNLLPFGGSRGPAGVLAEKTPSSPRPASIASSDLPGPSTDGGFIWGPPADSHNVFGKTWPWSPENSWSRNPSRRPSTHGSPAALKTTLASAEDEILDEEALMKHQALPSQVGVIGSRPLVAKKKIMTLNPAAPTFMTNLLNQMTNKDKSRDKVKDGKEKSKSKDGKGTVFNSDTPIAPSGDESPSDSRISRDTPSVHTQTSVSESRESLSLDTAVSNTLLDSSGGIATPSGGAKDPDNVVKKLFRKGSSSKFSFTSRLGGSKKGPGSTANSEKNASSSISAEQRSSFGDLDDSAFLGPDDSGVMGRNYDSVASSPSLGPLKSGANKERPESRMSSSRWFSIKKKGKEKESLELEREKAADSDVPDEKKA